MSKRLCRFTAILICAVLCLSAVTPVLAATNITSANQINGYNYSAVYGEKLNAIFQGKAKMFSNSSDAYALGQNIKMNKQYAVANVISGQQCYIYAQAVYHYLFGDVPYHGSGIGNYWNNSKRVLSNVTSVSCQSFTAAGVGFGAYIRTTANSNGSFSGSYGHSMILLGYDASGLTYLDCNGDGKGAIRVTTRSWAEFNRVLLSSKGRRIAHVVQPTGALNGPAADLGASFTAVIGNTANQLLTGGEQIRMTGETGSALQLWYFVRQNDGSYKISSCQDGGYLEIKNKSTGAGLQTAANSDSDAQKWILHKLGSSFALQSKLSGHVVTLKNGALQANTWDDSANQLWTIQKNTLKKASLSVAAGDDASGTTFTWDSVYGAEKYNLHIWKGEAWTGEEVSSQWNAESGCTVILPAGDYQAYVDACHQYASNYSNVVSFTVAEHIHESITDVTDPSCTTPGYTTNTCLGCGQNDQSIHTDALGHKYTSILTLEPTLTSQGVLTGVCSRCDSSAEMPLPVLNTQDYDYTLIREPSVADGGLGQYTWKETAYGVFCFEVALDKLPAGESGLPRIQAAPKTVQAGEEFVLEITAANLPLVSALTISGLSYDRDMLELVDAALCLGGMNADWSGEELSATVTFPENRDVNGVIMTLTFRAKESAAGECTLDFTVQAHELTEEGLEVLVDTETVPGVITLAGHIPGDCNGDGRINTLDLVLLRQHLAAWNVTINRAAADFNSDGIINILDLVLLRQHLTL